MHIALKIRNYLIHFTIKDEWQGILSKGMLLQAQQPENGDRRPEARWR